MKKLFSFLVLAAFLFLFNSSSINAAVCGDGIREGYEECDDASANSDSVPNACRSNCTLPKCGDYAIDNGEECDDYLRNSDEIPNACRRDCRLAHCGDGVLDQGEQCDDKNSDAFDGCHQCMNCYLPKDDLVLTESVGPNVKICPGRYEFKDEGQEGIIIINSPGMRVDLTGVTLVGLAPTMQSATQAQSITQKAIAKIGALGIKKKIVSGQQDAAQGSQSQSSPSMPRNIVGYQGTGIVINAQDIVLHNSKIEGFKTGTKLQSTGAVLFNNDISGNQTDIVSEKSGNFGVKNKCGTNQNWQENGQQGCTN
jgi:cysteine-rich repeat protein